MPKDTYEVLNEIVKEIEDFISFDLKTTPQSVIFRSGMNTGLRIAKRIVEGKEGEDKGGEKGLLGDCR